MGNFLNSKYGNAVEIYCIINELSIMEWENIKAPVLKVNLWVESEQIKYVNEFNMKVYSDLSGNFNYSSTIFRNGYKHIDFWNWLYSKYKDLKPKSTA